MEGEIAIESVGVITIGVIGWLTGGRLKVEGWTTDDSWETGSEDWGSCAKVTRCGLRKKRWHWK